MAYLGMPCIDGITVSVNERSLSSYDQHGALVWKQRAPEMTTACADATYLVACLQANGYPDMYSFELGPLFGGALEEA